jgi:hypothetical protein
MVVKACALLLMAAIGVLTLAALKWEDVRLGKTLPGVPTVVGQVGAAALVFLLLGLANRLWGTPRDEE